MSALTVFLARLLGLFTVLIVIALVFRGPAMVEAAVADQPVMLTYGMISLAMGLAMVLGHNVWSGGLLPVVVTLVGWLILAKGLLLLALAPDTLAHLYGRMHRGESLALYIPSLVIGLYLTVAGFAAPARGYFLFEHDLHANAFRICREGKPVPTFLDHALASMPKAAPRPPVPICVSALPRH